MKRFGFIDRIVFSVTQVFTIFGMLMFLFLPMLEIESTSVNYFFSETVIGYFAGLTGSTTGSAVALIVFMTIAAIFTLTDVLGLLIVVLLSVIVRRSYRREITIKLPVIMAAIGLVLAIALNITVNAMISSGETNLLLQGRNGYVVSTKWGWAIVVCGISMVILFIYAIIKAFLKYMIVADGAAETGAEFAEAASLRDGAFAVKEIREYKQLLDEGAITQEEFDKKKRELLK